MITFIQQGSIKLIKSDSEGIYNVVKIFIFKMNAVIFNFKFKES